MAPVFPRKERKMSGNLPPGCADKDIDDAAPREETAKCPNCQRIMRCDDMELMAGKNIFFICPDCYKVRTS
jgi:hypothetical protein